MAKSKRRHKKALPPVVNKAAALCKLATRLNELCSMVDCEAMSHITSMQHVADLNRWRFRIGSVREVISEYNSHNFRKHYTKIIKYISNFKLSLVTDTNHNVNLIDLTYINALKKYIESDGFPAPQPLRDKYTEQLNRFFTDEAAFIKQVFDYLLWLSYYENMPDAPHCAFGVHLTTPVGNGSKIMGDIDFTIYVQRPIKDYVKINGQSRPVYQIFTPAMKAKNNVYSTIQQSDISQLYKGECQNLPVYIQGHAINRLKERTAPINPIQVHFWLSYTLMCDIKPIIIGQNIYIPYYFNKIKVGYLVSVVTNHKIVIRTFILITHASAPEGKLFQTLTGLSKIDMNYWDITQLPTFIYNDMPPDNPLYDYFKDSDLLPLFKLNSNWVLRDEQKPKDANWQQLAECLDNFNKQASLSQHDLQNTNLAEVMA